MVKIWLKHWFSTARNITIIELMRKNNFNLHITGVMKHEIELSKR